MTWVTVSALIFIFMQIFQCTPIDFVWKGWDGTYGPHKCLNVNVLVFTAAGFSIAQDIVIIFMPIPLLAQLQASWRVKLGVILMFSLGIFVLITSCIRLRTIVLFARSTNPTWDYVDTLIWTGLECAVSIIVTSLPAIRALAGRMSPGLFSRAATGSGWSAFAANKLHGGASGRSLIGRFISMVTMRTASRVDTESQLELGDKIMGDVCTEIGAGGREVRGGPNSTRSPSGTDGDGPGEDMLMSSPRPGIRVLTTTTTTVRRH